MQSIVILGRQPALGLAELESRLGAGGVTPLGAGALIDSQPEFMHLGSVQKAAKLLTVLPYTDWRRIRAYLTKTMPEHLQHIPEGKIKLGISLYGHHAPVKELNATGLELKKVLKAHGRSARIIANKEQDLNSAQVLHGGLLSPVGLELIVVVHDGQAYLGQTTYVQDIDAYAARDQARPARDSRVGMLPPKLAQTIINLAVGSSDQSGTVFDPFCGTGVVLQEALLMDYAAYGTDLEPRMIEYSQKNLAWLQTSYQIPATKFSVEVADATTKKWTKSYDTIACETYLGRPFSALPDRETLQKVINDCDAIHRKFLQNIARQTPAGFRMCIAVPAWHTKNSVLHLKTLANLGQLGYTRMSFVHAGQAELIYHRPGQIVGRELVVLQRI